MIMKRETTKGIAYTLKPEYKKMSMSEIEKAQRRNGSFTIGYHFILFKSGEIKETGLSLDEYADIHANGSEDCICVLIASDKVSDVQRKTLNELSKKLNLKVIDEHDEGVED